MKIIDNWFSNFFYWIFVWSGSKLFNNIDLYIDKKTDIVKGVTWSNDKKYLNYVSKFKTR